MERAIGGLVRLLPLIFGLGFFAPVLAELLLAAGIAEPLGLAPLTFGLLLGGAWGLVATITGRWL